MAGGKRGRQAGFGLGSARTDSASLKLSDPSDLLSRIETRFRDPDYMPPVRPEVAEILARLATMPGVGREDVTQLFEMDPLLAGRVIRVVIETGGKPIRSFKDLWSSSGTLAIHQILVRLHRKTRILRNEDYARVIGEVAAHCAATARLARLVARDTPFPEDYAWLCGILHDVGLSAGLSMLSDARPEDVPELDQVLGILDDVHDRATFSLARLWQLPPDVRLVLAGHHDPFRGGTAHPVAAVICIADWMAASYGWPAWSSRGLSGRGDDSGSPKVAACRIELGMTPASWALLEAKARRELGSPRPGIR